MEALKARRRRLGLSQREVARRAKVAFRTVQLIESGGHDPRWSSLRRLGAALGVDPARLDAAKQAAKAAGGEIKAFYLVMGRYDFVLVFEAPNDEAAAAQLIATGMQGNVRTETMRAFPEDEYRKIIAALP